MVREEFELRVKKQMVECLQLHFDELNDEIAPFFIDGLTEEERNSLKERWDNVQYDIDRIKEYFDNKLQLKFLI